MTLYDTFDRLNQLADCLDAVQSLLCPGDDLALVDRDQFTGLLGFLLDEQKKAMTLLYQQLQQKTD